MLINSFNISSFYLFTYFYCYLQKKNMLVLNAITYSVYTMTKQRNPTVIIIQKSNQI